MTEVPHEAAEAVEKTDLSLELRDTQAEANEAVSAQAPEAVVIDDSAEDIGDAADVVVNPPVQQRPEVTRPPAARLESPAQEVAAKAITCAAEETSPVPRKPEPLQVERQISASPVAEENSIAEKPTQNVESQSPAAPETPAARKPVPAREVAVDAELSTTAPPVEDLPELPESPRQLTKEEVVPPEPVEAERTPEPQPEIAPSAAETPEPESEAPDDAQEAPLFAVPTVKVPEVKLLSVAEARAKSEYEDIPPWEGADDETVDPELKKFTDKVKFTVDPEKTRQIENLCQELEFPFRSPTAVTLMYEVAEQMQPHLTEYSRIIGDDTSGRLPALVYRKLINQARAEAGLPPAQTFFMAGSGEQLWREVFPHLRIPSEGRTLVVTEFTSTGHSTAEMYYNLIYHTPQHEVDFAIIGADEEAVDYVKESAESGSRLFVGTNNVVAADLLYHPGRVPYKGVYKRVGDAVSVRQPEEYYDGKAVARARQDAARVAEKFGELLATPPEKRRPGLMEHIAKIFKLRVRR